MWTWLNYICASCFPYDDQSYSNDEVKNASSESGERHSFLQNGVKQQGSDEFQKHGKKNSDIVASAPIESVNEDCLPTKMKIPTSSDHKQANKLIEKVEKFECCLIEDVRTWMDKTFGPVSDTIIEFSQGPFIKNVYLPFTEYPEEELGEGARVDLDVYAGEVAGQHLLPHEEQVLHLSSHGRRKTQRTIDPIFKCISVASIPLDCIDETKQLLIVKNTPRKNNRRSRSRNTRPFFKKDVYILIYMTKEIFVVDDDPEWHDDTDDTSSEFENDTMNHYVFTIPSKNFEELFLQSNKGKSIQKVGQLAINFAQALKDNVNTSVDPNIQKLFNAATEIDSNNSDIYLASSFESATSSRSNSNMMRRTEKNSSLLSKSGGYNESAFELASANSISVL